MEKIPVKVPFEASVGVIEAVSPSLVFDAALREIKADNRSSMGEDIVWHRQLSICPKQVTLTGLEAVPSNSR